MSLLSPQLEAFVAVVRQGTVHGAARELRLTQTGVTQRLRGLERSLSTTLFTRSRKGMRPTSEGEALYRYCQAALEMEGEALAGIQPDGRKAEVRVCITGPTSILESRIAPQCLSVMAERPELVLSFVVNDLDVRLEDLKAGRAHLAVLPVRQVAREMDSKVLRPEEYVLVGPVGWKRRPVADVVSRERIIDFDPSDPMSHNYLRKHRLLGAARKERHFVNNNRVLVEMFARGIGYGVLTTDVARPLVAEGRIAVLNGGAVYEDRSALAWYPRREMPAYFRALIAAMK